MGRLRSRGQEISQLVVVNLHRLHGHSGNIQGTFREHSGNIQGTFRERTLGTYFREHSGNFQRTFGTGRCKPPPPARTVRGTFRELTKGTYFMEHPGNIRGTFGEHSGNIQETYLGEFFEGTLWEH
jgi:hypothetical protein